MFTVDCSKTHDKIQHISLWIVLGPMGTDKIQHISLWTDKIQHKAELLGLWGLLLLLFLGLWGLIKFNILWASHKKIDGCGRFQGHYRLDKFQIQPEKN
jgi:hypothetical protein